MSKPGQAPGLLVDRLPVLKRQPKEKKIWRKTK